MSEVKDNFKILTDVEHVLQCPQMYIGSMDFITKESFIYQNSKFIIKEYSYKPALIKIVDEIIDNAVDAAIRDGKCDKVEVIINEKSVNICDNGAGIPVRQYSDEDQRYLPEIAWTQMKAGTSFNKDRQTIGAHGLGSVATNIFSKYFKAVSCDGKHLCTVECTNNLSTINTSISKHSKSGVSVYFEPDWSKFELPGFDQTHIDLIYQRILNLSICFPQITFWFNGTKIKLNSKGFVKMFNPESVIYEDDKIVLGVVPNEYDEFKFYSYVNGIKLLNGGNHIDIITTELVSRLREKLTRKCKGIMPGDIKNRLALVVFFKGFTNPKFDSQTKERLTNSNKEINEFLNSSDINFDNLIKQILKNEAIISPIVDTFKIKEELKLKKDLKKTVKRLKSDKYFPPIGDLNYCFVSEGFSAAGGISSVLGRQGIGYYALKGVMLNAYDTSLQKIATNVELKELSQILGIQLGQQNEDMDCDKLVVATDMDYDGHHITGIFLGICYKYLKKMFEQKRIMRLTTPLVVLFDKKDKPVKYFFNLDDYKNYVNNYNYRIKYFKGLGSWKKEELQAIIAEKGLDFFLQPFELDQQAEQYLDWWLKTEYTDKRKEFIQEHSLDLELV